MCNWPGSTTCKVRPWMLVLSLWPFLYWLLYNNPLAIADYIFSSNWSGYIFNVAHVCVIKYIWTNLKKYKSHKICVQTTIFLNLPLIKTIGKFSNIWKSNCTILNILWIKNLKGFRMILQWLRYLACGISIACDMNIWIEFIYMDPYIWIHGLNSYIWFHIYG